MTNIKPLMTERDVYAQSVIERLEEMLKAAKDNPQRSVVIIMVDKDQNIQHAFATINKVELLGHIEFGKWQLCD